MFGNAGNDILDGSDVANGGVEEWDILTGGSGQDIFILGDAKGSYYLGEGNQDLAIIKDFKIGEDKIRLAGSIGDYEFENNEISKNGDLVASFVGVETANIPDSGIKLV